MNTLDELCDEVKQIFCPNFKGFGRNLDAVNDVLSGGFGIFDEDEQIDLIWINMEYSENLRLPGLTKIINIICGEGCNSNVNFFIKKRTDTKLISMNL